MNVCPECGARFDFIESSRVMIKQDPTKEGVIELRKGIDDISLGNRVYAQVRIRVGNARAYIKGMAIYSDKMPEGYDVIFYIGNEFDENGKIRGTAIDIDRKFKKPLTIIEPDYCEAWAKWASCLPKKGETK